MTVAKSIILRELGELSATQQREADNRLRKLFNL